MIRDPSDGSVKEPPKAEVVIPTAPAPEPGMTSALSPVKAKEAVRLHESREWLQDYHAKQLVKRQVSPSGQ